MDKLNTILIVAILSFSILKAQINLNVGDGLTIETTGGTYIELSGDLEENGKGYLKGIVTSGDRGEDALSHFAGLSINSGAVDKITRITGSAFSETSPKTSLRNYETVNTTAFTSNISSVYVESGTNSEANGIESPFLYSYNEVDWIGYLDSSTNDNSVEAANFSVSSGTSNIVITDGVGVAAKILLEGPYATSAMSTSLTDNIPLVSPYAEDARTVTSIPADAVDWVLVQLRDHTTPSTVISSRSAFVKYDGNIIDDTGNNGIRMPSIPGDYYLAIKHRNHLSVMSSSAQSIDWITTAPSL